MESAPQKLPFRQVGDFGFTNDINILRAAEQFRDDAVADGFSIEPTYGKTEGVDRASSLRRDGYHMLILTRNNADKGGKHEASVSIWAPDGLSIHTPEFYDFNEIVRRTRVCKSCGAEDVDTERFSFAGRCCASCLPKMRQTHEYPGWNN